jgi:hypothetical protein
VGVWEHAAARTNSLEQHPKYYHVITLSNTDRNSCQNSANLLAQASESLNRSFMAVFISYSHVDAKFVDVLATNLVRSKHHIWMDRWELNIGDSLTDKIEQAITESDAILVILSKTSVESQWCRRELTAGLVRELEERKTLVLPCVIDDCKLPLFLKDKLRAEFHKDAGKAFELVDRALAKFTNATQGRSETPEFLTDWSVDWADPEEHGWCVRWTFVDHGPDVPYVVLSECVFHAADERSKKTWMEVLESDRRELFMRDLLRTAVEGFRFNPLKERIQDSLPKYVAWKVDGPDKTKFAAICTYRRMGQDTGMDTILHVDNNLATALGHMEKSLKD